LGVGSAPAPLGTLSVMTDEELALRENMFLPLQKCVRCSAARERYGDEVMEEIVFHVMGVVDARAVHRWFHRWNSRLRETHISALEHGRITEVLAITRQYEDPGFA